MKPSNLCRLTTGKALAAFPTFVATFNWLVDFCNNLTGGKNVEIDRRDPDHPIINAEGGGGSIDIRCMNTDGDQTTASGVTNIVFSKGEDSNVSFKVSQSGDIATVSVDVYYA